MPTKYLPGFDDPSVLREIEASRLLRLIAPHRAFFAAHGCELPTEPAALDIERLAVILLQPQPDTPPELIDALTHIHEVVTLHNAEFLREQAQAAGLALPDSDSSPTDLAVHIWLERPSLLRRFHAEHVVLRRRSFHTLQAAAGAALDRPLDLSARLERLAHCVREGYASMNRGRSAYIIPVVSGDELRLVVPHGAPYCRRGCWRESEPSSVGFRPMEFAYAVLDWANWELRLNCKTLKERRLLASGVGRCLLGDAAFFTEQEKYTLDPLRRGSASLVCSGAPGVRRVRLVALTMRLGGPFGRVREESADDLFAALDREDEPIPEDAELLQARFAFEFADSPKPRPVTLARGNRATYTRDGDGALVERFFEQQRFSRRVKREALALA